MGARDRAHEQDDRHDHQPGGDDGCSQTDLALAVEDPAARGHEHQHEGAKQLGEEPSPLQARVVELSFGTELERQQVPGPRTEQTKTRSLLLDDVLVGHGHNLAPATSRKPSGDPKANRGLRAASSGHATVGCYAAGTSSNHRLRINQEEPEWPLTPSNERS